MFIEIFPEQLRFGYKYIPKMYENVRARVCVLPVKYWFFIEQEVRLLQVSVVGGFPGVFICHGHRDCRREKA